MLYSKTEIQQKLIFTSFFFGGGGIKTVHLFISKETYNY